jgi:Na+/H+ antiporter NhaD/arsenite permease-like protein
MANPKTASEWAPILAIVAAWLLLIFLLRRLQNTSAAKMGKSEELESRRKHMGAWGLIVAGVIFEGALVASWRNVPPGNEAVVAATIVIGVVCVVCGAYRLYRLGK